MLLGQPETVVKAYDEAIKVDPWSVLTYIRRCMANFNLGQYRRAIDDYGVAVEISTQAAVLGTSTSASSSSEKR